MNDQAPVNKKLNELSLNLLGKVFFASCAAWVAGKFINLNIRGTQAEVNAVTNALMSSKRFQDELRNPGATVDSVIKKLNIKQMSAQQFQSVLGIPWPL